MIGAALRALLRADATVEGLLAGRIYPVKLPRPASFPAVVYTQISGEDDVVHDGASGLCQARYQLDCFAKTHDGAKALARAVRAALNGYRGTSARVAIHGAFKVGERDDNESGLAAAGAEVARCSLDFMIWWKDD